MTSPCKSLDYNLIFSDEAYFFQLFAASGAMMVFVFTGVTEAQSAVMLPQLKKPDSYIRVGPDEETWIGT